MFDVTWCGGIRKPGRSLIWPTHIKISISPHTGAGPLLWFASIQTATALTNLYILQSVYHLYNDLRFPRTAWSQRPKVLVWDSNYGKRHSGMARPSPKVWQKLRRL
jgi:L-alanine-DL-glutamate epimerase-like enolase superfamily enzyme